MATTTAAAMTAAAAADAAAKLSIFEERGRSGPFWGPERPLLHAQAGDLFLKKGKRFGLLRFASACVQRTRQLVRAGSRGACPQRMPLQRSMDILGLHAGKPNAQMPLRLPLQPPMTLGLCGLCRRLSRQSFPSNRCRMFYNDTPFFYTPHNHSETHKRLSFLRPQAKEARRLYRKRRSVVKWRAALRHKNRSITQMTAAMAR